MERLTKRKEDKNIVCFSDHLIEQKNCYFYEDFCYKVLERLAYFEDLEQDGRLVVLPCKVGDVVYSSAKYAFYDCEKFVGIQEGIVRGFEQEYHDGHAWVIWVNFENDTPSGGSAFEFSAFGKTVFLTREEAEAALAVQEEGAE